MKASPGKVTQLLVDWRNGNQAALEELLPLVYDELKRLAHHYMRRERSGHTLQTTAIVNEAYLRLVKEGDRQWHNRAHFFAVSAQVMRHLLVDHARSRQYAKRGGGAPQVSLDRAEIISQQPEEDLMALDEALTRLAIIDSRKSRVVEMRYFGGLNFEEVAEALDLSVITVKREWLKAKAWLYRELSQEKSDDA